MLNRIMILVALLATTGLVGCGEKDLNQATTQAEMPVTKDAHGKDLPSGMTAPQPF